MLQLFTCGFTANRLKWTSAHSSGGDMPLFFRTVELCKHYTALFSCWDVETQNVHNWINKLEIMRTETLSTNRGKINRYESVFSKFNSLFWTFNPGKFFSKMVFISHLEFLISKFYIFIIFQTKKKNSFISWWPISQQTSLLYHTFWSTATFEREIFSLTGSPWTGCMSSHYKRKKENISSLQ